MSSVPVYSVCVCVCVCVCVLVCTAVGKLFILQQMPFPPTATDFFLQLLSFLLSVLIIISFLYTAASITKVCIYTGE